MGTGGSPGTHQRVGLFVFDVAGHGDVPVAPHLDEPPVHAVLREAEVLHLGARIRVREANRRVLRHHCERHVVVSLIKATANFRGFPAGAAQSHEKMPICSEYQVTQGSLRHPPPEPNRVLHVWGCLLASKGWTFECSIRSQTDSNCKAQPGRQFAKSCPVQSCHDQ